MKRNALLHDEFGPWWERMNGLNGNILCPHLLDRKALSSFYQLPFRHKGNHVSGGHVRMRDWVACCRVSSVFADGSSSLILLHNGYLRWSVHDVTLILTYPVFEYIQIIIFSCPLKPCTRGVAQPSSEQTFKIILKSYFNVIEFKIKK